MVLCAQTDFVKFLEQVLEVLKEVEIDKTECYTLLESVQKQQLVIPVVGNFSVGKSTLLNRFLEKSVLPTGITPETSLATELHYSVDERIEAFSNNDEKAESFELNEQSFEVIKENATKYSYLKVYLNNEALKTALPLVFVDMPGFDSPISSHTHAILEYLERGVHFVILTSVEEGSLTKRMVRELKNLLEFDKGLSFILSKTNLRTPSQAEEVSHYIEEQIQDHLDLTTRLIRSDKDNNALLEVADKIDAEKLFSSLYLKRLKLLNARLQNSLKSVIERFDYSKEKALEEIKALDLGVKDIEKTYEKLRANLEEEYSSVAVGSVVKKVLEDVREQKPYLASLINKPNELNSEIESITQQSLIKNTKLEIEKINLSFSKDFHAEFESLNNTQLSSDLSVSLEHNLELGINPGVNDPILSREERTKALLKDCHVVFIISPSDKFLTDSDMGLFDRVSNKEGLQEIYFVASQTDSVVCAPSEVEKSRHHLPTALEMAQKSLSSSLDKAMESLIQKYPNQRGIFEKAIKNGVILTSGVCFSMY
ncbi:hypothetical protein MM0357_04210 [Helicobacter pylori]